MNFLISFRVTDMWQPCDHHSDSDVTLKDIGKHNKPQPSMTLSIILRMYHICELQ